MKTRSFIISVLLLLALSTVISCSDMIANLNGYKIDQQDISSNILEMKYIFSHYSDNKLIVETQLGNGYIELRTEGFGETKIRVFGTDLDDKSVERIITIKVSREGSISSWVTESELPDSGKVTTSTRITNRVTGTKETVVEKTAPDGSKVVTETVMDVNGDGTRKVTKYDSSGTVTGTPVETPMSGFSPVVAGVSISGDARIGGTLTAVYSGDSSDTIAYQWYRYEGVTGTPIAGATGASYVVIAADSGKELSVKITGSVNCTGTAESPKTTIQ